MRECEGSMVRDCWIVFGFSGDWGVRGEPLLQIVLRHLGHGVSIACAQPRSEVSRRDDGVWKLLYDPKPETKG